MILGFYRKAGLTKFLYPATLSLRVQSTAFSRPEVSGAVKRCQEGANTRPLLVVTTQLWDKEGSQARG